MKINIKSICNFTEAADIFMYSRFNERHSALQNEERDEPTKEITNMKIEETESGAAVGSINVRAIHHQNSPPKEFAGRNSPLEKISWSTPTRLNKFKKTRPPVTTIDVHGKFIDVSK